MSLNQTLVRYQALLQKYLSPAGEVRYESWHNSTGDVQALDAILREWTENSPNNHPEKFDNASRRLSYWLNLYNALVIREVIGHWPLESVRDVQPTLLSKVVTLKGFFRDLHFDVGGQRMHLGDIENKVIRAQFKDARIHFALNCGSASCPVLRKSVFDGEDLELQLNEASREFVANENNVRVDHDDKEVLLSKIFKWYRQDFDAHARAEIGDSRATLMDFLLLFAEDGQAEGLGRARAQNYAIRFMDYDWSLNAS